MIISGLNSDPERLTRCGTDGDASTTGAASAASEDVLIGVTKVTASAATATIEMRPLRATLTASWQHQRPAMIDRWRPIAREGREFRVDRGPSEAARPC